MKRQTPQPASHHVAFVPRPPPWRPGALATALALAVIVAGFLYLAGPAAALLLRLATILLTVALAAGLVAFTALRIGAARLR